MRALLGIAIASALILALAMLVRSQRSTPEATQPSPGAAPSVRSLGWLPTFMASGVQSPGALFRAADHNAVIVGSSNVLGPIASQIHRISPRTTLLAYGNAVTIWRDTFPDGWYSHDLRGQRIFDPTWRTWLMNPANEGWVRFQVTHCRRVLRRFPDLDGCFLDQEGAAALVPGFDNMTGTPVDPGSGQVWSPSDWMAATQRVGQRVKSATGRTVIVNGLTDGPSYDAGTSVLLRGVDGAEAEGWLRRPDDSATHFPSVADWERNVDMIAEAETQGAAIYAVTKVWSHGTTSQIDHWRNFAWCSFLLAQDGRSRFYFTSRYGQDIAIAPRLPPGSPTAASQREPSGLFLRAYTGGTVIVNPTGAPLTTQVFGVTREIPGHTGTIVKPPG